MYRITRKGVGGFGLQLDLKLKLLTTVLSKGGKKSTKSKSDPKQESKQQRKLYKFTDTVCLCGFSEIFGYPGQWVKINQIRLGC